MMADLLYCRIAEAASFTFCGVDMFGSFIIKQRSQTKCYGAMFTCISCQAVHIEITHFFDNDSFIIALRHLIARIGNVQTIFSDNGSNFTGSENNLRRALLEEMDKEKVQFFMQELVIGLLGKGTLLMPAIWVVFENIRTVQPIPSCLL